MNINLLNVVYAGRKTIPKRTRQIKPIEMKIGSETVRLKFGEGCDVLVRSVKTTPVIKAANLVEKAKLCTRYISYPPGWKKYVENADGKYCRLKRSLKPKILQVVDYSERTLHISESVDPYGTIAIASTLDKTISTNELYQCAAMAIVDREQNLQVLMHCSPYQNAVENRTILEYIMSHFKKSSPEITFVPGCYHETGQMISFLIDNLADIMGKKLNIKFAKVPKREYTFIGLRNGQLGCSTKTPEESDINHLDKIIFSSIFEKNVDGKLVLTDIDIKTNYKDYYDGRVWRTYIRDVYYNLNNVPDSNKSELAPIVFEPSSKPQKRRKRIVL